MGGTILELDLDLIFDFFRTASPTLTRLGDIFWGWLLIQICRLRSIQ